MIEHFTLLTGTHDQYKTQAKLRYQEFVARQGWQGPSNDGVHEWDEFDTPTAHYLLYRDEAGEVRGCLRMLPTLHPYMVEELWPDFVDGPCPKSPDIWEITRVIAHTAEAHRELVLAYHEVLNQHGATRALYFGEEKHFEKGKGSSAVAYHALGSMKPLPDHPDRLYVAWVTDPVTEEMITGWKQAA